MDLTISRPIRIFALVAIMVASGGGALLTLNKGKQSAAPPVVVEHPSAPKAKTATTAPATTPATPSAKKPAAAKLTGTRTAPPTSVAQKSTATHAASPVGANGLPAVLNAALRKHSIVVVSLFDPQSQTDAVSYAEARAGAGEARVGFLGVDLLDSVVAGALTTSLPGGGLLPEPGVLVYRRPGVLVERLDGFNDRDVVAQAAVASVTAAPITAATADATSSSTPTAAAPPASTGSTTSTGS